MKKEAEESFFMNFENFCKLGRRMAASVLVTASLFGILPSAQAAELPIRALGLSGGANIQRQIEKVFYFCTIHRISFL